jgi:transcriptional regulator with XRE-family HTH domain
MNNYTLDQTHTLLRDARLSAKLSQKELAGKLLCSHVLVSRRENQRLNLSLRIIAGICRACGYTLRLRADDRIHDIGPALSKLSIFTVEEIADEFGVTVRLVATKNR